MTEVGKKVNGKKLNGKKLNGKKLNGKKSRIIIYSALIIMIVHIIYMNINGIKYGNRELCIIYNTVPRWIFCLYEYFIELFIIVLLGVFAGVLIEKHMKKVKRFFPKNPILAFIYASFLPVCSCGVIPIVDAMKKRVRLGTLITFIVSAPLLNPYIIFISFTVLGIKYVLLRIVAAFVLAISIGLIIDLLSRFIKFDVPGVYENCDTGCTIIEQDPFNKTMLMIRQILPYILLAGALSFTLEFIHPQQYMESLSFSNNFFSTTLMILVGIPIYVCNGADVLFLKPLLNFTDLSMGAAMAFSLTSSAVCISSIVMLVKFFGKKITIALIIILIAIIILESILINLFWIG